ncbi:PLP-dependent aminotransferase family protein [Mangrovicella endophytica]|uniref:MocR-like pyridoxine biosynthesis transcription factor PdxR n=1 Tax=Mangrovicella endophytica TaxID=2066697 RepID=UPI000C9E7EA2|nr:PLP-dependent aminotransferase family protein [Mangrovicella endophytica]
MMRSAVSEAMFFVEREAGKGLQAQIREALVSAILSGRAPAGARLPSTRRLAAYLKVSRITVTIAYQELASQGFVSATGRSAYRIADAPPVGPSEQSNCLQSQSSVDWNARLRPVAVHSKPVRKPLDWRRYPYPFIYGQMDHTLFDLAGWRDCARRALAKEDFVMLAGDFAAADDMQLVDYIVSRTLPGRGIRARHEEVLVTVGAQNALWIVIQLLLHKGSHAACEELCHPDLGAALILSGAKVTPVAIDREGLRPECLPGELDAVFVTPSHHAPTAATMPMARRQQLLEAANRQDFLIVEDDYEFEMSFLRPPSPALKSIDTEGRVIYVGSFSKSLFPGLRLGYLVAPAPLIREARALRALMLRHPPGHLQRTAAYFLALGHYDAVIRRMRLEYQKRHALTAAALQAEGLRIAGASDFGGTSFWIEGPAGLDADQLAEELRGDGVLVESGSPFFVGAAQPCRYFRIAYSSISADRIEEGVRRIASRLRAVA